MSFHPSIDQRLAIADDETPEYVAAILAVGQDISRQLGRIADHLAVEAIAQEAAGFGRYPAGHPASQWPERPVTVHQHFNGDPNVATRDEAAVALDAAQSV